MILGAITAFLVALALGITQSIILTTLGVPDFIVMLISVLIGFFLPSRIFTWIYKEEIKAAQSDKSEE